MTQTKHRDGKIRPKLKTEEEAERFVKNSQETGEPDVGHDTLGTDVAKTERSSPSR
jgi:hypothetical protein